MVPSYIHAQLWWICIVYIIFVNVNKVKETCIVFEPGSQHITGFWQCDVMNHIAKCLTV